MPVATGNKCSGGEANPCARTKTKKLPVGSFFCFYRGKGENTGRRVRPQTKGRRSMPVATGNKCSGGEANPCARTKTKKLPVGSFFCFYRGKGENTGRRVRPQTKGRRSMPVATGNKCSGGEANPCARTNIKKKS